MTYDSQAIAARRALLDAAFALENQLESMVLIGAQAVYLYTEDTDVAIATSTKDSDIAVRLDRLADAPTLDSAMESAGFINAMSSVGFLPDAERQQGKWINKDDVPVELLVPEGSRAPGVKAKARGARIAPHSEVAARYTLGIEGAMVDFRPWEIEALDPSDERCIEMNVAGPAALVVAKTFKICERIEEFEAGKRDRRTDKDANDLYRLLRKVDPGEVVDGFRLIRSKDISRAPGEWALERLARYGMSPGAEICVQAGRAVAGVDDEGEVAESTAALIAELVEAVTP